MSWLRSSLLALATLGAGAPALAQQAVGPHRSWDQLPTGNGYGFGLYDASRARVVRFLERPYAQRTPAEQTRNVLYDAYFGVRAGAQGAWLGELPVENLEYAEQSHAVHATQRFGPLRAETYVLSPWGLESASLLLVLHVTNTSNVTVTDAAAYALLNLHLGAGAPEAGTAGEQVRWDSAQGLFTETGPSGLTATYLPLGAPTRHGASPSNPYAIARAGGSLVDTADSGVRDDAVAGYQWNLDPLAPGAERWVGVVVTLGAAAPARTWVGARDAQAVLRGELDAWNAWRVSPPAGLSEVETRVWRQSETVLRMGQVREPGTGRGQVLAALPPGIWTISWTRDMSYSLAALARMGHRDEANLAVDFFRGGRVGDYRAQVGTDYHLSVVRYYGDGSEWSDTDQNGPNIEFDGFGLGPWAAHFAGRTELDNNAATLNALVDPATGLVQPDSSIWEVHWNGQQKRFAYTTITAARGLCAMGDATHARALRDALVRNLVTSDGWLASNVEELRQSPERALDAAVVEALNWGLVDPYGPIATRTLQRFERLRTAVGRGYFRNDDGGGYDSYEWIFIDLRIAGALRLAGFLRESNELLAWVTAQADANYGLQAELYHPQTADYAGSVPMVGFGAGAYVLAMLDRAQPEPVSAECFPPMAPPPVEPAPDAAVAAPDAGVEAGLEGGVGPSADSGDGRVPQSRGCAAAPRGASSRGNAAWWVVLLGLVPGARRRFRVRREA